MRNFGTERNGEKYMKKVYELKKFSAEIKNSEINGKDDLIPGCTIERDQDPKPIQKLLLLNSRKCRRRQPNI